MIQERVELIKSKTAEIKNHCMCLRFKEDRQYYFIELPYGFGVDAVRCDKSIGKIKALSKILDKLENIWKDSFI
jgi:hypothetical protein